MFTELVRETGGSGPKTPRNERNESEMDTDSKGEASNISITM